MRPNPGRSRATTEGDARAHPANRSQRPPQSTAPQITGPIEDISRNHLGQLAPRDTKKKAASQEAAFLLNFQRSGPAATQQRSPFQGTLATAAPGLGGAICAEPWPRFGEYVRE